MGETGEHKTAFYYMFKRVTFIIQLNLCMNVLNTSATLYVNFSGNISGMTYYRCSWNYNNSCYIYIDLLFD